MKDLNVKFVVPVPKSLNCWHCSTDKKGQVKKLIPMYICSTQRMAETTDRVVWKCKYCSHTKAEKVKDGDGGRFYLLAHKQGIVKSEG